MNKSQTHPFFHSHLPFHYKFMMHFRWWLLVFALWFSSIKVAEADDYIPVPSMRWYTAITTFDYLKTNDEGIDEITPHNDWILMVAVDDAHIVGPGQVQCRHINPPNEQIVNIMATTQYYPLVESKPIVEKKFIYNETQCYQDTFGCITLVHNLCHIDDHDVPADFNKLGNNAVLKKDAKKPTVGDSLIAVFFHFAPDGFGLAAKNVKVVDFEECKKLFDPDNVYLVDPEEQLCTERVAPELGDDPIALHSALIFRQDGEKLELVAIESKGKEGFSLSTWAPYHCSNQKIPCQ